MMMSPNLRKVSLIIHVICSVGWYGALAAYLVLDFTLLLGSDAAVIDGARTAMDLIVTYAILPFAIGALVTGIVQSIGTSWGLFRHYWVVAKLLLTVISTVILVLAAGSIVPEVTDPALAAFDPVVRRGTLPHSVGGIIVLSVIMILSVLKPRGVTRHGWRKQREERRQKAQRKPAAVAA